MCKWIVFVETDCLGKENDLLDVDPCFFFKKSYFFVLVSCLLFQNSVIYC